MAKVFVIVCLLGGLTICWWAAKQEERRGAGTAALYFLVGALLTCLGLLLSPTLEC